MRTGGRREDEEVVLLLFCVSDTFHADFLEASHAVDAIKPYALEVG